MRKVLTALVAAAIFAGAAVATSGTAEARWRGGWRWDVGGFAAGATVGSALAAPYYYPYAYGYYSPHGYGYYAYYGWLPHPVCVWRRLWDGYAWIRACV